MKGIWRLERKGLPWLVAGLVGLAAVVAYAVLQGPERQAGRLEPRGAVQHFTYTEPPRPVPDTRFLDAAGQALDLSAFRGRVLLLNFWATWCAPCIREMPALDRLQAALDGPDFTVVLVSMDREGAKVAVPFLDKLGIRHLGTHLDPKGGLARAFGIIGLPTSILIDRAGREVGRIEGSAEWDAAEAHALIRHAVAEPD